MRSKSGQSNGRPLLAAVREDDSKIELELESWSTGLHPTTPATAESSPAKADARVSFSYYKATDEGLQEPGLRDVHVPLGTAMIGYGVHPDHKGEAPTWYLRAEHVGFSTLANGLVVPGARIAVPQVKNFSMARIVGGPLGNPQTDPAFRDRMGIAEIT